MHTNNNKNKFNQKKKKQTIVGWQIPQQVSKDWENTFRIWSGNGIPVAFQLILPSLSCSLFSNLYLPLIY